MAPDDWEPVTLPLLAATRPENCDETAVVSVKSSPSATAGRVLNGQLALGVEPVVGFGGDHGEQLCRLNDPAGLVVPDDAMLV